MRTVTESRWRRDALALAVACLITILGLVVDPGVAHAACGPEEATALYQRARRAFDDKRFDESVSLLRQANACDPNPVYFANIARALEEANRPRDALAAWKAYQEVVTDPRERSRAQGRITALQKTVDDLDAAEKERARQREASSAKPAPPPAAPQRSLSIPALVVTGVGLATAGVGLGLGAAAGAKHDDAVAERDAKNAGALQSDAVDLGHAANVVLVAGGVLAAGGIVWLAIDWSRGSPPSTGARSPLLVTAGGRGLVLRGTF